MTELTYTAGERATLDLRDSKGDVVVNDWDGATIKMAAAEQSPHVLRDGDTFRIKMASGGTISLPIGLPAEVLAPDAVRLRVLRAGGETAVRAAPAARGGDGPPDDLSDIAEVVSEHGRRILKEVSRAVRAGGAGVSDDVTRRLEEAAQRIDEQARRAAERVQREVERTVETAERYEERGRRAATHAEERARRMAERLERRAERAARHVEQATRGGRGRWWFTERLDEWAGSAGRPTPPRATEDERRAILQMLQEGKITTEQAARLLDALGG